MVTKYVIIGFYWRLYENARCKKHGVYTEEDAYVCKDEKYSGGIALKCKKCVHEWRVKRYAENRQQAILDAAIWKKANRERVNKQVSQDKIDNPEKYKKWNEDYYERNKKDINTRAICGYHGLDIQSYEEMIKEQNNQCAICGKIETRKFKGKPMRLCVDHNHETGKIRGLLCHDCNTGLGKFLDSPDLLTKAAIYLMES